MSAQFEPSAPSVKRPGISIVTAVYNRIETVADAIRSVQSQTYSEIEHVIVDGLSTDGTPEVVRQLECPGMVVVSEKDDGIYDAINKGLQLATGEILGLMHSDDLFAGPHVLNKVAAAFADPSIDVVYGDLVYVAKGDPSKVIRYWRAGQYSPDRLARGWMPPHPTLYVRRRVLDEWGLYDTSYRIAADYDAILRYFGRGGVRPVYLPEVLVKMRVGGESNRSLGRILRKSREDYRALRANRVGGLSTLALKNLSKIGQFFVRS